MTPMVTKGVNTAVFSILAGFLYLFSTSAAYAQQSESVNNPEVIVGISHADGVKGVVFSPDGQYIASGGGTIRIWEVSSGRLVQTIPLSMPENSFVFSPDSRYLFVGGTPFTDIMPTQWEVATGKQVRTFQPSGANLSVENELAISHDGTRIAFCVSDVIKRGQFVRSIMPGSQRIAIFDTATGDLVQTLTTSSRQLFMIRSLAFTPDGKLLRVGSGPRRFITFNLATGQPVGPSGDAMGAYPRAVALSRDGRYMATTNVEDRLRRWDLATGAELGAYNGPVSYNACVAFSTTGNMLATTGLQVTLWNTRTGQPIVKLPGEHNIMDDLAFSPSGPLLAIAGDSVIELWDVVARRKVRTLGVRAGIPRSVTFSPNNRFLAITNGDHASLIEVATGRQRYVLRAGPKTGTRLLITQVAFSPDSSRIACGGYSAYTESVAVFDTRTGRMLTHWANDKTAPRVGPALWMPRALARNDGSNFGDKLYQDETRKAQCPEAEVREMCFQPQSNLLAIATSLRTASSSQTYRIFLLDSTTGQSNIITSTSQETGVWRPFNGVNMAYTTFVDPNNIRWQYTPIRLQFGNGGKRLDSMELMQCFDISNGLESSFAPSALPRKIFNPDVSPLPGIDPDDRVSAWSQENGICIYDDTKNKVRTQFAGKRDGTPTAAAQSPDGRYFASASMDQTVRLWDTQTGNEVLRFYLIGDSDQVTTTPDNFYISTKTALSHLNLHVNNQTYSFEQFDMKLNRPDVILERLGYAPPSLVQAYNKAYEKRLKKNGFTPDMLTADLHVPELSLDYKTIPVTTRQKVLPFIIRASDSLYLLSRLHILVNDVPIAGSVGVDLRSRKVRSLRYDARVNLTPGRNKIQVSVLNEKGAESFYQTFEVFYAETPPRPTLYVLAIGVSDYKNPRYELNYAAKDAQDLSQFLGAMSAPPSAPKPAIKKTASSAGSIKATKKPLVPPSTDTASYASADGLYARVVVKTLLDSAATRENILGAKQFLNQAQEDDHVLVFLAGHGLLDTKLDYYFGTYDIDFAHPDLRGLAYDDVEGLLDGIRSRNKLLLMDTCHAGETDSDIGPTPASTATTTGTTEKARGDDNLNDPETTGELARGVIEHDVRGQDFALGSPGATTPQLGLSQSFLLMQELFADLRRGSGASVIAAAAGAEYAYEKGGNGIFTYTVLEGLRNHAADTDGDGKVSVSELRDFVADRVSARTGGRQKPTARRESLDFDFSVY